MEIKQFITSTNFRKGNNKQNLWIVIHYTANNGDTAKGNCNYFSKTYRGSSANYFVDENEVYQCVKDEDIAWHCNLSKKSIEEGKVKYYCDARNENSIGVELCSRIDKDGNYYFKKETIWNAQRLVRDLMKKYGIDLDHVVRHYDVTHKECPRPFVRDIEAWKDFKKGLIDVAQPVVIPEPEKELRYDKAEDMPSWAQPTIKKLIKYGFLKGDEDGNLDLSLDMIRMLIILDRANVFNVDPEPVWEPDDNS